MVVTGVSWQNLVKGRQNHDPQEQINRREESNAGCGADKTRRLTANVPVLPASHAYFFALHGSSVGVVREAFKDAFALLRQGKTGKPAATDPTKSNQIKPVNIRAGKGPSVH
jgi:hypothetical protein